MEDMVTIERKDLITMLTHLACVYYCVIDEIAASVGVEMMHADLPSVDKAIIEQVVRDIYGA